MQTICRNSDAYHLSPAGTCDRGLRAAYHGVSGHLGHSGYPEDRPDSLPVRKGLGFDCRRAVLRHSALPAHKHLRHGRCDSARRTDRFSDCRVSGQARAQAREGCHAGGREHAGGHSLRGLRPCGYADPRAGHPQDLPCARRRKPACSDHRAGHHDPAVHHQSLHHRARSRSQGIRGRFPRAGRNARGDLFPCIRSGGQERHRRGSRAGRRPRHRRGHGCDDGRRQRGQHALAVPERALSHHGRGQRNVLRRRLAAAGAVFHRAGAVPVHHAHYRHAEFLPQARHGRCRICTKSSPRAAASMPQA